MDNEVTKVLNKEQNENNVNVKDEKKGTNIFGQGMATAAGAAVGTGAAMAADHVYEHVSASAEAETPEEEPTEEVQTEETANEAVEENVAAVEEDVAAQETPAPQVTTVNHVVTVRVEAPQTESAEVIAENVVPADAEYIDDAEVVAAVDTPEDNEVHVIGVAIQDNGQGGVATLAALQSGDDVAVVVDVESDGRIDVVGIDDNGNGQLESGEWHQVEDAPFSTGEVVGAYVEEAQAQGSQAIVTDIDNGDQYQVVETETGFGLASIEDSTPDETMMVANDDDMPDYMNDADAGLMMDA